MLKTEYLVIMYYWSICLLAVVAVLYGLLLGVTAMLLGLFLFFGGLAGVARYWGGNSFLQVAGGLMVSSLGIWLIWQGTGLLLPIF